MSSTVPRDAEKAGDEDTSTLRQELEVAFQTILGTLAAVTRGELPPPLDLGYPGDHPAGTLADSVNSLMQSLGQARAESEAYLEEVSLRIEQIERQREAIDTLSVPVIEVWSRVLCIPIVGVLDSVRAANITTALMETVVRNKARYAIIDLTGIEVMDTQSADHFLRMARSVTLLGAKCALSGIHPNIARTIIHMGLDLGGIKTFRSMREALRFCVHHEALKTRT